MNTELFIKTRKKLGYSQEELSKGICTQATLSKFEKSGKAPSIKILIRLCERLGLTLDDIFPITSKSETDAIKKLDHAEFQLITSEFDTAKKELASIKKDDLQDKALMQYYFIKGFVSALEDAPLSDTLFYFDQILNGLDDDHQTVFSLLAFTGVGTAYFRNGEIDKSEFYFQKVFDSLYSLPLDDERAVWRALSMIFYTADYYAHAKEYDTSNSLLEYAYGICAKSHVTYYVARIQFRRAQNIREAGQDDKRIGEYLNDAAAFARINNNQKLLKRIEDFV
ncbi:transcriptional regulator [Lentilactobacillus curieae]|uniref:Transcriptional regulator n=1 Tax=Lentilactobacillus curieae TaxID=1138822 RepID=A0A1S6QGT4_9LACO|nr:helix-turn-helix domain-containing protein [Lentilactobacillus curieae]AQW20815.1 transcriptional regulator [Lentilactobacillus curieae]